MWQGSSGVCKSGCQCNSVCVCVRFQKSLSLSQNLNIPFFLGRLHVVVHRSLMIFAYHCICSVAILEQCNYTFTIFHPFQSISPIWAFHRPHGLGSNEQCAQIRLCRFHSVSIWPSVEICWVCTASGNQNSTALRLCARLLSWSSDQNFALPRGHGKSPCFTRVIFSVQVWRSVALMFSISIGW